jgi:hypothetical protein
MSFEAELRLPGAKPYEYVNIVVRGEKYEDFVNDLRRASNAVEEIRDLHRAAADVMLFKSAVKPAPKAEFSIFGSDKPNPLADVFSSGFGNDDAQRLIERELDARVIEETPTAKPWERPKPQEQTAPPAQTSKVNLF